MNKFGPHLDLRNWYPIFWIGLLNLNVGRIWAISDPDRIRVPSSSFSGLLPMSPMKNHQYNFCCINFFTLLLCSPYLIFSETCIQLWYIFFYHRYGTLLNRLQKLVLCPPYLMGSWIVGFAPPQSSHRIRWQKLRPDCGSRGAFRAFERQQFPPDTRSSAHQVTTTVTEIGNGKRKRGRLPKGQSKQTPLKKRKEDEEEDVCFICFDGVEFNL